VLPAVLVDYPRTPLVVENTVHVPSEHVVRGHRHDMEIHLVHQDDRGATLVLAVLADITRPARGSAAGLLRRTLRAAPAEAGEETDTGTEASAVSLLPLDAHRVGPTGPR